jgi:hypothetical protein
LSKNIDFENKQRIRGPLPVNPLLQNESFENPFASDQRFILVLYDEYENPVAITVPHVGTGTPYQLS